jgi:hypothetical protein
MLIRQIRSYGSQSKKYGVHAGHRDVRKPEVFFKTPTYMIGGSNYSPARQGGFILRVLLIALFLVRNLNKKIEESGTMPPFIKLRGASGRREAASLPDDSFLFDGTASLICSSQ